MCEYIVPNVRCADDGFAVLGAFSVLGYPVSLEALALEFSSCLNVDLIMVIHRFV